MDYAQLQIRRALVMQVDYTITCEPEDDGPEGHFSTGDDEQDRLIIEDIRAQLDRGNEWAWCCVKVTASVELDGVRFTGDAYLGGCSYASQTDFEGKEGNGGYLSNMKKEALADLEATLVKARDRGQTASLIRKHLQEA